MSGSKVKSIAFALYKHYYQHQVLRFKNKHQGEDCYIFGDGVSLKWFYLPHFADKVAIVNGLLPFHNDFKVLNAKYCILAEPYWFYNQNLSKYISNSVIQPAISSEYKSLIDRSPGTQFFVNFSNLFAVNSRNVAYLFKRFPNNNVFDKSLGDLNYFKGSLRTSISLAIYMGFKNIFLVGCDYTHSPSLNLHWYERGKGKLGTAPHSYEQSFLISALSFANISTITLPGVSSAHIKAIDYFKFTGYSPSYRENTDLLETRYLQILDTCHNYTIY